MSTSFPVPGFSLRRRSAPGLEPFEALLDLLPQAALLIDANSGEILLSNAKATELTTFTRGELNRLQVKSLFPALDNRRLQVMRQEGSQIEESLILVASHHRNLPPLEVYATLTLLDSSGKWILLEAESAMQYQQRKAQAQYQAVFLSALGTLAEAMQKPDSPESLGKVLEAGGMMTGADLVVVYQADGSDFILTRSTAWGPGEMLPEQIQPHDLMALNTPHLWMPGKRTVSGLHRAARSSNLSYLASVPLGQSEASIGILAAAGEQGGPSDQILTVLKIVAGGVASILQNQALETNIENRVHQQKQDALVNSAIHETVKDGILMLAPDLTIQELNASAEAILGYASREVEGQPYQNILVGIENIVPPFLSKEPDFTIHDLGNQRLYRRDGQPILVHLQTVPVIYEGALVRVVVLIEDLSQEEQFRLRNQQLEQRAILGEFTAIFAHEVRNPINNISTGLQLMGFNLPPDDPNQDVIARLQHDCDRLTELMKSVLSFAKPMEYSMKPLDLGRSIQRIIDRWQGHMTRVNIQSQVQIEPELPMVEGDPRALEQVWTNLISNALQAMGQDGTLTIKVRTILTEDKSRRVEVSVTDTGPGIPEEIRERIFEPFFTTNRNGTGLGLAITKHIISTHKGSIQVMSIPGGTVFQVQLPVIKTHKHPIEEIS